MPIDQVESVSTSKERAMAQPVQYVLREPFFISSRLMPAVNVADATIHMQADTIDRDDDYDPRVVWQYTIEGPDVYHAGRDLTTPYLGPATVAGQLTTTMGTLLEYLSHVADGDNRDGDATSLPDPLYQWARRNRDEIAMMADLVENGRGRPMPASAVWWAITHDPDQTRFGRWCAGQATAHADRIATLNPRIGPAAGLVVRDEAWHETALAWYTMLTNQPEPEPAAPACVVADRDAILAWLRGPAPDPSTTSMAQYLGLAEAGLDWRRIPDLVDQAQLAGLFGVAGHTIRAHAVVDEHTDLVAHLLTITTPDGANLATPPTLAGPNGRRDSGPYAVPDILQHYATRVDDALATHARATKAQLGHSRPFPRIDATPPAELSTATVPTAAAARPPHHR